MTVSAVSETDIPSCWMDHSCPFWMLDEACCDGSDETSGLAVCPDRCAEVAAVYAKEQAALHLIQSEGAAAKQKLIDEAEKTVTEWQEEKARLEDALAIKRAELMRRQSMTAGCCCSHDH